MRNFSFEIKLFKIITNFLPINNIPKWINVWSLSLTIMIFPVGVLPNIQANYRNTINFYHTHHKSVILVICLIYYKFTRLIFKHSKPNPSWQKSWLHTLLKRFFKSIKICEIFVNSFFQFSLWGMYSSRAVENWKEK